MGYRGDLDGLRAIAVLLVLGYHALVPGFAFGFLGVDMFFVLSGYLIAQGIFTQMAQGTFRLGPFYERRLRRILPALVAMLLAITLAATLLLYPPELEAFARSLLAASLQVGNLYFAAVTDYFAEGNSAKPLLHTWSLGLEQQFYLVFPILCLAFHRLRITGLGPWIFALALLSFALWVSQSQSAPTLAFFSPLSRGWQILSGALLASHWLPKSKGVSAQVAGFVGLGLLLLALTAPPTASLLTSGAVLVTLGTCLLIWSGEGHPFILQRLLSLPPLVFIGALSYSLYLWHWPILRLADRPLIDALAKLGALESLSAGILRLALLALSFGVAILSWHFIEKPFRHSLPIKKVLHWTLGGSACTALLALALIGWQGWPSRFPAETSRMASYLYAPHPEYREHECFLTSRSKDKVFQQDSCLGSPNSWALLGDSHAAHLAFGMQKHFGKISQITASGCKPVLQPMTKADSPCKRLIAKAYADWLSPQYLKGVVIAARWRAEDIDDLIQSVHELRRRGLEVHVIGPQPQYYYEVPLILASGQPASRLEIPRLRALDKAFADRLPKGSYHSVFEYFCTNGACPVQTPTGIPVAFDYSHLTAEGSRMVFAHLTQDPSFPRRTGP